MTRPPLVVLISPVSSEPPFASEKSGNESLSSSVPGSSFTSSSSAPSIVALTPCLFESSPSSLELPSPSPSLFLSSLEYFSPSPCPSPSQSSQSVRKVEVPDRCQTLLSLAHPSFSCPSQWPYLASNRRGRESFSWTGFEIGQLAYQQEDTKE